MELEKAKILLEKLQSQIEQVQKGDDAPSNLERDLLLMYTRQLYDAFLAKTEEKAPPQEAPKAQTETKKKSSFSFKSFDAEEKREKETSSEQQKAERERQAKEEAAQKEKAQQQKEAQERLEREKEERERQVKENQHRKEEQEQKAKEEAQRQAEQTKEEVPDAEKETKEKNAPQSSNTDFNEDYDELFSFEEATDLSQKLSQSPVKNLRKGLGINDKMLYGQELFGGNIGRLHDTLDALDELRNMTEARAYLEKEVLSDFDWAAKDKKRYARDFLKYIRRRYL